MTQHAHPHTAIPTLPQLTSAADREAWHYTSPSKLAVAHTHTQQLEYSFPNNTLALNADTLYYGKSTKKMAANTHEVWVEIVGGEAPNALLHDTQTITLAPHSTLAHIRIHTAEQAHMYRQTHVIVEEGAQYNNFTLCTNQRLHRHETHVKLTQPTAAATLLSLNLLHENHKVDSVNNISFLAPNCTANVQNRTIAAHTSRGVFQGKFLVDKDAQQTDAHMRTKNLLLSPHAQVYHKPELEIYADNVKCAHGASTGALDEEALFYLRTRGLNFTAARHLLVEAFAHDILTHFSPLCHEKIVKDTIANWLNNKVNI